MDWDKIKENCPKAFGLWKADNFYYNTQQYFRLLYDFFDKQGIMLDIRPFYYDGIYFLSSIITTELETTDIEGADTRIEAEIIGFTTAFEILETKLNKE